MFKKNSLKFTLQFNLGFSEQKLAAEVLNSMGRKKAEYIAALIYRDKVNFPAQTSKEDAVESPGVKELKTPVKSAAVPNPAEVMLIERVSDSRQNQIEADFGDDEEDLIKMGLDAFNVDL